MPRGKGLAPAVGRVSLTNRVLDPWSTHVMPLFPNCSDPFHPDSRWQSGFHRWQHKLQNTQPSDAFPRWAAASRDRLGKKKSPNNTRHQTLSGPCFFFIDLIKLLFSSWTRQAWVTNPL